MRFSVTMDDDLIEAIDREAGRNGIPRTEWIRNACTEQLTPAAPGPTPEEHQAHQVEVIELRTRTAYQERTIADLTADREYHRGEIARLQQEIARVQQENSLLTHRLLPPPRAGALSRFKRWVTGEPDT
ncbi:MAG: ribbon-helix-helix protein, CopG family [Methanoculleus horonobensis]|nr:ribbon-helix-helix protein, CopG family [Methanoculleus horonobensis]